MRKWVSNLVAALAFCLMTSSAWAQPEIPDTFAGQVLKTWLDTINSADPEKIQTYTSAVDPSWSPENMLSFSEQTGGFELLSIESSAPRQIRFVVKEKNSPTTALGNFLLTNTNPPKVETSGLRALPPGVTPEKVVVGAALRKQVIDGVSALLGERYVDAAAAKRMQALLQAQARAGAYNTLTDGDAFAARLTKDLQGVNNDRHLNVAFNPFKTSPIGEPSAEDLARNRAQALRQNCAFEKVEILAGNIALLKFNAFFQPEGCKPTVAAAMAFIANTDAVIIDLRANGGGSPEMVTFIASYFFEKPTHLNSLYNRKEDSTKEFWTLSDLPGERLLKQPVFLLTSKRTFSGAEEFAYDLKNQQRATIVGETTGGGAHPTAGHVVANYFVAAVPSAKAINPVSKTNWEGVGVTPDVPAPAAEALAIAIKLATEKLRAPGR